MITIFSTDPKHSVSAPSAFVVSLLLHCFVLLVVVLGFKYSPRGFAEHSTPEYPVRFIRLEFPKPAITQAAVDRAHQSTSEWHPFRLRKPFRFRTVKQTLVSMDVPPDVRLKQPLPIPLTFVWSQTTLPSATPFITPAKQIPNPAQSLSVPLSLDLPDLEIKPSELRISNQTFTTTAHLVVPPSAAAPVQISGPEQGNQLPQTPSTTSDEATAAHVISVPDILLRAQDLIVIPPANQIAAQDTAAALPHTTENGAPTSDAETNSHSASQPAQDPHSRMATSEQPRSAGDADAPEIPQAASLTRITLPKDGNFGVVVMGSQASELYLDSTEMPSGNVVYTVYVHVGLQKNWILQYWLPKNAESDGTAVDAPWPFLILRPDQLHALNFEYIIVHGVINTSGRFEQLSLVYPGEFEQREELLGVLRQWTFRPARRSGEAVAVEALLAIPRQEE